jgi:Bacterial Ig-like domain
MATPSIQLLSRPNQANWTGTRKAAAVKSGDKVAATGDTVYQFVIDDVAGLPKGTKIVKRDAALEFQLPDGRVFQLADWCGVQNARVIDLATATVYDEASGKYIDGVDAVTSSTCGWVAANGAVGSVGAEGGLGLIWAGLAAAGLAGVALASRSSDSAAAPVVVPVVVTPPATTGLVVTGLTAGTNSGLTGDQVTNLNKPSLTGKGTPGDKITVTLPTGEVLTTTVDATGNWTVAVAQALPEGANQYQVVALSPAAGATPSAPINATVTIDTVRPAQPAAVLNSASDSGTAGDNTTNDTTPTISGTGATPGDTITVVTPKGETLTTVVAANGTWSVTPTVAFALGAAAVQITETDPNGNASAPATLNLTIVAPVAPPGPGTFTAAVPEGPVINSAESISNAGLPVTVTLPSNAAAGDVITVSIDGSTPVSYTVLAGDVTAGTASVTIPTAAVVAAGPGPAQVTTTYANAAGSAATPVITALTIDTVAPGAYTPSIAEGAVINAAESASDGGVPVVFALPGNAAVGDVITVSIDGSAPISYTLIAADVTATSVSILIPTATVLAAGQGTATVATTYTDAAGNPATPVNITLTIDTVAPTLDLDGNNSSNAAVVSNRLGLFNTGLNADGSAALTDGQVDSHYSLASQPAVGRQAIVNDSNPGWLADDADSRWLGGGSTEWEGGEFLWQTTFDIPAGTDLSTVLIKFDVGADNFLTNIFVNGAATGLALDLTTTSNNFLSLDAGHGVELSGTGRGGNLFQIGSNIITFALFNGDAIGSPDESPHAFRIDNLTATYLSTGGSTTTNLSGFSTTYVENSAPKALLDADAAVVEASNIQSATITLTNFQANDVLSLTGPLPTAISAGTGYDSATGILTLTGAATAADYQTALGLLVFSNSTADPASNPSRVINFTLTDAAGNTSAVSTANVTVVALEAAPVSITPIAIDLNGDGAITYSQVSFDVNSDGAVDRTAWVGANDGVLVWDKYQDGMVTNASQYAFSQYGGATDLQGLAAGFDSNNDGVFSAADAKFQEFAVWQDANQNGSSDAGEVITLSSLGLTSIDLASNNITSIPAAGVQVFGQSSATTSNGSKVLVEDAQFFYTTPVPSILTDLDLLQASQTA